MLNILILNWNSAGAVKDCINGIIQSNAEMYRIILINNFSNSNDLNEIRRLCNYFKDRIEISLIENENNLGYSGGNNSGIRFLVENNMPGDILVLNPDVMVSRDAIPEMRKALTDDTGIVTVRTVSTSGKILFDAIKLRGFIQKRIITSKPCIPTDYSQGSCMLIKREIINRVGMFDERFFLYWEEVDFSFRVKNADQKLIAVTTTKITRNDNRDELQPGVIYYSVRNARLIMEKHPDRFSKTDYLIYISCMALISFKYILKPVIFFKIIQYYFYGLADSSRNRYYAKK